MGWLNLLKRNLKNFPVYLSFLQGSQSHDTSARLWDNISHEQFHQSFELFLDFLKETAEQPTKIINIDGKTLRNSSLGHGLH
jgi:hypothetical protein